MPSSDAETNYAAEVRRWGRDMQVWGKVADHCNKMADHGASRMPAFAKAMRAALSRRGIEPREDLVAMLERCENGEECSASAAALAARAGVPEDEVATLVYLIF